MTATLSTLRDRVERLLADNSNAIWSTDDIDEGIRQALHEYSLVRPFEEIGTVTLAADGREISTSTLTGLLSVTVIWTPYTAADPEWPPNIRPFKLWYDEQKIYVDGPYEPQNGEVVRVFYTKLQTLNGLDSETTTTIPLNHETLLATGAAGYAATGRSIDLMEKVTLDRLTAQQVRAWGLAKLQEFRSGLSQVVAKEMAAQSPPWVRLPALDRWDRDGRGWS